MNIIWTWLRGFCISLISALLCMTYLGVIITFIDLINNTGWEAAESLFYFIWCVVFTIFGTYGLGMLDVPEEER